MVCEWPSDIVNMASQGRRELCLARRDLAAAEDRAMRADANRRRSDAKGCERHRLASLTEQARALLAQRSASAGLHLQQVPQVQSPPASYAVIEVLEKSATEAACSTPLRGLHVGHRPATPASFQW